MTKAFSYELIRNDNQFYCYVKVIGRLSHEDYENFIPTFESVLKDIKDPKVKVLADITKLEGWDIQAAWDDIKFGLSHNNEFEKIAVVGHSSLYEYGVKISNWFTPYEMKYFSNIDEAKAWLDV